jgi:hypothetical protein
MVWMAVSFEADHIAKVVIVSANGVAPEENTLQHGVRWGRVLKMRLLRIPGPEKKWKVSDNI